MAPGASLSVGGIPKMARPHLIQSDSDPAPFENGRLREHMRLLVTQRFNFLVQVQLLIRPHFLSAGHVQTCAPPGSAIAQRHQPS